MPAPNAFRRTLYISTARAPITEAMCEAILRISRRNNHRDGITGLLVTGGTRFLQVLEGHAESVGATLERIGDDPRHFGMVVLSDSYAAERLFPDWSMGHCPTDGSGEPDSDLATLTARIGDPTLRAYFEGFAEVHAGR